MFTSKHLRTAAMAALSAAVAFLPIGASGQGGAGEVKTLQIEGSTTVGPIAVAFADWFMRNHPGVKITVKQTGSGDGAAALIDKRCDIATMSRFMKPAEFAKAVQNGVMPVAHVVAMDGVCVIVHQTNPVRALTTDRIRDIYTGRITNWKQLGGPDRAIVVMTRDTSSGTFETFETLVMNKQKMDAKVETVSSNPAMYERVKSTPGGVGYVGLAFVKPGVAAVKVNGVMPNRKTINEGTYPVTRPLFLFTNGYPKLGSPAHAFVTFHLKEKGQAIIEDKGFVPLTDY